MTNGYDLAECLTAIDPTGVAYGDFIAIGMALKDEGYPFSVWEDWAKRDAVRYKGNGAMERKWEGFGSSGAQPVTGGTIVKLARDAGWAPPAERVGEEAWGFDDVVELRPRQVLDPSWVEPADGLSEPASFDPASQLAMYLRELFEPDEHVGYVVRSFDKDGRRVPADKGSSGRTASELIAELEARAGDPDAIGAVLGDYSPEGGAWIRFNPLDGKGVRNDNVADYRHALVESDDMDCAKQLAIIRELELPCAAIVHSGGKSVHAIVRVEADGYDEYRRRVDYLYKVCAANGLVVDTQNKNPSRLSRMPGVMRGGRKQFMVSGACGKPSWEEWRDWVEEANDGLPDIEPFDDWDGVPEPPEPLVAGMLYPGDKMMIAGRSKAGKSFALIELCIAMAEGATWLGRKVRQGKVLYVNLELKADDRKRRFKRAYEAMGLPHGNMASIHTMDLRGKSAPLDKLASSIVRRAVKSRYQAVIIDPIYKVIAGDENSAEHVAKFCNQLDFLAESLGCAVIYCHHHSKGSQGGKASMDRASGSGVFARDADALLDMIELPLDEAVRKQREGRAVCDACAAFLDALPEAHGWHDLIGPDEALSEPQMLAAAKGLCGPIGREGALLEAVCAAREASRRESAWRVEGTLREFPSFEPVNLWFRWPVHEVDATGVLAGVDPDEAVRDWKGKGGRDRRRSTPEERREGRKAAVEEAFDALGDGSGTVAVKAIAEYMEVSEKTVRRRLKEHGGFSVEGSEAARK